MSPACEREREGDLRDDLGRLSGLRRDGSMVAA